MNEKGTDLRKPTRMGGSVAGALAAVALAVLALPTPAPAVDYNGTVGFTGQATLPAPIPNIAVSDLTVSVSPETEATGSGVKCSISATTSDNPDLTGAYPDAGSVSATMLVERGGGNLPDGACIVKVTASGTDGVSVSARGSQTAFVPVDDVNASATVVVDDIVVRQSKAIAGIDKECRIWAKKQLKLRDKCNALLLKKGPLYAEKCKDAGIEPPSCDPGDFTEAILQFAHAANNQQVDPPNAENVDPVDLTDQIKCQKRVGKAAVNLVNKYVNLINKKCVATGLDDATCRATQLANSRKKLDQIDKCVVDQLVDGGTGRTVPVVDAPCDVCIVGGLLDRKCLKSCFELTLPELADGIVGDLPVCGNGILQGGEFCDDGNLANGDCCSDSCFAENLGDQTCGLGACEVTVGICSAGEPVTCVPGTPGTEGPALDPTCADGIDNDCDGLADIDDTDCQ